MLSCDCGRCSQQHSTVLKGNTMAGAPLPDSILPEPQKIKLHIRIFLDLLEDQNLSFGAKCLYGRLVLHAGKDGKCNPSHATLAKEIGIRSGRQVRRYLAELQERKMIEWRQTGKSCSYLILEFQIPERTITSTQSGHMCPIRADNNVQGKDVLNRGSSIDVKTTPDYDCLPQPQKPVAVRPDVVGVDGNKYLEDEYPSCREAFRSFLRETDPNQPSTVKTLKIIQACGSPDEWEILLALEDLEMRGYGGTRVRTYKYLEVTLADYFRQKRDRENAATPIGYNEWKERNDEIERKAAAFDYASR